MRARFATMVAMLGLLATPAAAQELRELCPERPGLGTPACTVDPGHLQIEAGVGDWTLDKQMGTRTDTIVAGDLLARYGVGEQTELQLGWQAYGHQRMRDTSGVERLSGTGDVMVGLKQNLAHPDGDGLSIALLPFATLPTGGKAIGAGDWGAGLIVPVTLALDDKWTLELTPEADAKVDEDRDGRHLAYSAVAGLEYEISKQVSVTGEVEAMRDRDPGGHETTALAALSIAYQPKDDLQLDVGLNGGLNHTSPDVELYFGISRRF